LLQAAFNLAAAMWKFWKQNPFSWVKFLVRG